MSTGNSKRNRLFKLWQKDCHCSWCKKETILILRPPGINFTKFSPVDNEATIDHLFSRLSGLRTQGYGEEVTVLSCWKCNNNRSKEEEKSLTLIELWKRANHGSWEGK